MVSEKQPSDCGELDTGQQQPNANPPLRCGTLGASFDFSESQLPPTVRNRMYHDVLMDSVRRMEVNDSPYT